jgi:ABC-type glycerol-3-phosphate transport system substrate-binding protein
MKDLSAFQLIFIAVVLLMIILAGLILTGVIPVGKLGERGEKAVTLTVWGSLPKTALAKAIFDFNNNYKKFYALKYTYKDERTYEAELLDAMAAGTGPDIFLLTQDLILKHKDKAYIIPFETYDERTFRDTFLEEAELFITDEGIVAVPFAIDPIIMYWNRDLFSKAGVAAPPEYWEELVEAIQNLTEIDRVGNVLQSGVAMGEFDNVNNAKEIFSFLVMQGDNDIINPKTLEIDFGKSIFEKAGSFTSINAAENALRFYTEFSNPSKLSYCWNRALSDSKDAFIAGKLGIYFGYASEYEELKKSNPHLNFDVATVPQIKDSSVQATFGKVYAFAAPRRANPYMISKALGSIFNFVNPVNFRGDKEEYKLVPVQRSLLKAGTINPILSVSYKAAVQSRAWLEPDPAAVSDIFKSMIESVTTGKKDVKKAINDAKTLIKVELDKVK